MMIRAHFNQIGPAGRALRLLTYPAVVTLLLILAVGCDTTPGPTLYDEDRPFREDPVIAGIEPENAALAGIGTVTINGENFSEEPAENLVYFDDERVEVISASPTQLVVASPNLPGSGLSVRMSVVGSENFSNTVPYTLEPAVREVGDIADFEESFAITLDDEFNLYASIYANNASLGILRILPDGTREVFSSAAVRWDAIEFGPDGQMYGVRNAGAIYRFPQEGGEPQTWANTGNRAVRFTALTIDENGIIWVGGRGGSIYSADAAGTLTAFPFEGTVRSLVEFDGDLYALALVEGEYTVTRLAINNGTLGEAEPYFNLTEAMGSSVIGLSLAATEDGALIVGTNADDPLVLVEPDGTHETFYPGLIDPPAISLAWGEGTTLYLSRTDEPDNPSRILSINTQREGAR